MIRLCLAALIALASSACVTPPVQRPVTGLSVKSSWCEPGRGSPPDPALGLARPVRVGIGAIVHAQDGTTESFLAQEAWTGVDLVPGRRSEVLLVDHPVDADYSISGQVTGRVSYERETHLRSKTANALLVVSLVAFSFGASATILGTTLTATGETDAGKPILTGGLIGMSTLPIFIGYSASRPGNIYEWSHGAQLVLRRNGVRIGEFRVVDDERTTRFSRLERFRRESMRRIWRKASEVIGQCIEADLRQEPVR